MTTHKVTTTIAIILALLSITGYASYMIATGSFITTKSCYHGEISKLEDLNNVISGEMADSITVFISGKAADLIDAKLIVNMGLKDTRTLGSLRELPRPAKPALIVLHVDDIVSLNPVEALETLANSLGDLDKFTLMILNPLGSRDKSINLLEVILKFYGSRNLDPILPIEEYYSEDKQEAPTIHSGLFSAEALAFSVNPMSVIIVDRFTSLSRTGKAYVILTILDWAKLISRSRVTNEKLLKLIGSNTIVNMTGARFIGSIGWITANWYGGGCGEVTGTMGVLVEYFYTNVTTPSGKVYHAWFAHVMHSARGEQTTCCYQRCFLWWCWDECVTYDHYPYKFNSTVDWMTWLWPGQVLNDWNPKNTGTASTITFTVTFTLGATFSQTPSMTVQYSTSTSQTMPSTPYFEWWDQSIPWNGTVITIHYVRVPSNIPTSMLNGVTFTVEPTSVAFLDPDKPGGVLPMIVYHVFTTVNNHGDTASISFGASLWPSHVYRW
jgi:hypothetical protein